ncbi:hypothetical protein [Methylobacterium nodulans]|uniref:hypothetical protein n=1 Tax=Methylobacterium nodulans TaxID=114616 RepID=UPI0012ED1F0B|nr:hypothetical protein [Methylobacterium nodulans]
MFKTKLIIGDKLEYWRKLILAALADGSAVSAGPMPRKEPSMRVPHRYPLALVLLASALTVFPAHADPRGGGGMGGGGTGMRGGGGAGVGGGVSVGRSESTTSGKKILTIDEYETESNRIYQKILEKNRGRGIDLSVIAGAATDIMNKRYRLAKPEKYDNDAAFERGRIQNREMRRINSRGQSSQSSATNDPYRLKKSGLTQQEHDLLYNRGAKPTGDEW